MANLDLNTADAETLAGIRGALGVPDAARTLRFADDEEPAVSAELPDVATREEKVIGFTAEDGEIEMLEP